MKTPVLLLLTNDPQLEDSIAHVLVESGGCAHLAHSAGDALEVVCGTGRDLDLAVIDFEAGPQGMTLLSAINACRGNLPIIVVTRNDEKHVEALAYANGAITCLAKPIFVSRITEAINECTRSDYQLALVA